MSNFGIGLGSFLSGAVQGANAYAGIQNARSQQKLNDIKVKEAENDYAEKIKTQDTQAEVDRIGKIGLESAQLEHGDDVKKVLNHYYTNTIPQQQQRLIQSGKVEAADTLGRFMETKQAKQLTESSALAIKQASMGDYANLGPTIETLLNTSSSVTGGGAFKFKTLTELKDAKGNKTGAVSLAVTDSGGKEQKIDFNTTADLIGFIRNNAMPDKIVEYAFDQEQQAKKVRADTAKENLEWTRKTAEKGLDFRYDTLRDESQSDLRIAEQRNSSGLRMGESKYNSELKMNEQGYGSGLRMQEQANQAQLNNAYGLGSRPGGKVAEAEATIAFLRKNGVPEEYIQANITSIAGLENKSRPMSSRVDDYVKMRSGADIGFSKLTAAEQVSEAKKYIAAVDGQATEQGAGGAETQNPFIDQATGEVVYR